MATLRSVFPSIPLKIWPPINASPDTPGAWGVGVGYSIKFGMPRFKTLAFFIYIYRIFTRKGTTFTYIQLEHCTDFWWGCFNGNFSYPFPYFSLWNPLSLPFYIPPVWKRFPFRAKPPSIVHYREYPPPLSPGYVIEKEFTGGGR